MGKVSDKIIEKEKKRRTILKAYYVGTWIDIELQAGWNYGTAYIRYSLELCMGVSIEQIVFRSINLHAT